MKIITDIEYFLKYLTYSPIFPYLKKWGLHKQFELVYLKPGQRFRPDTSMFVVLAEGLLKQYYRSGQKRNRLHFIQFIMERTVWIHETNYWFPTVKALRPSYLLTLPLYRLEPFTKKSEPFWMALDDLLSLEYASGFYISTFLHELKCADQKLHFLEELYGNKLRYLTCNQLCLYAGISDPIARKYLKSLFNKS